MKLFILLTGFLLISIGVQAEIPAFNVTSREVGNGTLLVFTPPGGHHFNEESPSKVFYRTRESAFKLAQDSSVKEARATAQVPENAAEVKAVLYLCDDAKTYCMPVTKNFKVKDHKLVGFGESSDGAESNPLPQKVVERTDSVDGFGFFINNPEKALAIARAEKRPVLIDFYGVWCPPCNQLDELVYSSREFQTGGQRFVKLKLDADDKLSWPLKEKYRVGGYPTVVFTDSTGDELGRLVGYREKNDFVLFMNDVLKNEGRPLTALQQAADKGDSMAARRLAGIYLDRHQYAEAAKYYELAKSNRKTDSTKNDELRLAEAKAGLAKQAYQDAQNGGSENVKQVTRQNFKETLQRALKSFPASAQGLEWGSELASLGSDLTDKSLEKQGYEAVIGASKALLVTPRLLKGLEIIPADLYQSLGDAYENLGDVKHSQEAYGNAVKKYDQMLQQNKLDANKERGFNLEKAFCLSKSGKPEQAQVLYERMEKAYPDDFTFYFAHASFLKRQKDFKGAEPVARKAYQFSYGDNRLRVLELLGKVLKENGKVGEARTLVAQALSSAELPKDVTIRTHRYYKNLQKLSSDLGSQASVK